MLPQSTEWLLPLEIPIRLTCQTLSWRMRVPIHAILHETLTLSCRCYTSYDSFAPKADIEKRCGKIKREAKADPNFLMYVDTHSCYAIRGTDHKLAGATSAMRVTSLMTRL